MRAMPVTWPNLKLRNFRMFGSECDYLMLSTYTGVVAEYEIKVAKADLVRECQIAGAARENDRSSLAPRDSFKFDKHASFWGGRTLPPNYYSFVVPCELLDICSAAAPEYAGIYKAERASTGWISIKSVRCAEASFIDESGWDLLRSMRRAPVRSAFRRASSRGRD